MVSIRLSPLAVEEESALEKPSTLPPKDSIALSKLKRVRVLEEQRRQDLAAQGLLVRVRVGDHPVAQVEDAFDLLHGEIGNVNQVAHGKYLLIVIQ